MPGKQLYKTDNKIGTVMTYKKGTSKLSDKSLAENIGTCGALSSLVLLKMLGGVAPAKTQPDQGRAAIVFAKSWIQNVEVDKFNKALMTTCELKPADGKSHKTKADALKLISTTPGHYFIDLCEGHIVSAANAGGKWYFFDSNDHGLWEFASAKEFTTEVAAWLKKEGWEDAEGATTYAVTAAS